MLIFTLVVVLIIGYAIYQFLFGTKKATKSVRAVKEGLKLPIITPLPDFDWSNEEPIPYRPMKLGPFKLTMGLRKLNGEEQFVIDKTYLNKTQVRSKIIDERGSEFIFCEDSAKFAARELYDHCINFFTTRYPNSFIKIGDQVWNKIKDEYLPFKSESFGEDMQRMLFTLGKNVEEDFVLLMEDGNGELVLKCAIFLLPSGFEPKNLKNLRLDQIHKPVPQYESKLKLSMAKFFKRVKEYEFVCRNNWSLQTHIKLNDSLDNHGRKGDKPVKLKLENLNFNQIFFRSERQVVTRLPESKLVIMSIKTYFTPLIKLREEEESRKALIGAIEGLPDDFAVYKNKIKWDELVLDYLNLNCNGLTTNVEEFLFQD